MRYRNTILASEAVNYHASDLALHFSNTIHARPHIAFSTPHVRLFKRSARVVGVCGLQWTQQFNSFKMCSIGPMILTAKAWNQFSAAEEKPYM
jgi:hypothetical protein